MENDVSIHALTGEIRNNLVLPRVLLDSSTGREKVDSKMIEKADVCIKNIDKILAQIDKKAKLN